MKVENINEDIKKVENEELEQKEEDNNVSIDFNDKEEIEKINKKQIDIIERTIDDLYLEPNELTTNIIYAKFLKYYQRRQKNK